MFKKVLIVLVAALLLSGCGEQKAPSIDLTDEEAAVPLPEPVPLVKTDASELFGEWKSDCLVPDPESDWAERHSFVFYMNGQATHVREEWYTPGCVGEGAIKTDVYNYKISEPGKINLESASGEGTVYDIYAVVGDTLRFGHGFRDKLPYDAVYGDSPANRIPTTNNYIVYRKVGGIK